jgi:hypothetical protein
MSKSFNHFDAIAKALKPVCAQVVRKVALDCQANIQNQIRTNDQIDTGFMVNSVYVVTNNSSDYKGGKNALPSVAKPKEETEALVAVAAEYAIYQEMGTRFQPGRAFFAPGVERTRPGFEKAITTIENKLREAMQ